MFDDSCVFSPETTPLLAVHGSWPAGSGPRPVVPPTRAVPPVDGVSVNRGSEGLRKLTLKDVQAAPDDQRKQRIGERLFLLISKWQPKLASRITGMILEMENSDADQLLEDQGALKVKVAEALELLGFRVAAGMQTPRESGCDIMDTSDDLADGGCLLGETGGPQDHGMGGKIVEPNRKGRHPVKQNKSGRRRTRSRGEQPYPRGRVPLSRPSERRQDKQRKSGKGHEGAQSTAPSARK